MKLSAAVLAGGRSTRMGRDKATLDWRGRPLASVVAGRLRTCADDVFVVAKAGARIAGERVETDRVDVDTPAAGILTALEIARHPLVFVCGCDMPCVDPRLVALLYRRIGPHDIAVPVTDRREVLHAMWRAEAAPKIARALDDGERAVHRILDRLDVVEVDDWRRIDPEGASFANVNEPTDLEALLRAR